MSVILMTGAAGFIGQHLRRELLGAGHSVIAVDRQDGDLREPGVAERIVGAVGPEIVVHLAAQVGREFGEDDLAHTVTSNPLMTARVARACQKESARLVVVSTSEVYGDLGDGWAREGGEQTVPHNLYGLSKRWAEEAAALYMPDEGLQVIRLSMPYGPGLPAGRGRAALINFLWAASHGLPITVHRGASRCWCWVGDTVAGMRRVIEVGRTSHIADDWQHGVGVYNIGRDDNETSMLTVAQMACELVGGDPSLIRMVQAPGNQTVVKRLSMSKIHELGWSPAVDLADGMRRTWEVVSTYDETGMPRVPMAA